MEPDSAYTARQVMRSAGSEKLVDRIHVALKAVDEWMRGDEIVRLKRIGDGETSTEEANS